MPANEKLAIRLAEELQALPWQDRLPALREREGTVFSTSFGFEDQVLTHIIAKQRLPARLFTLDTGRLFEETQALHQRTREIYGTEIETYYPDAAEIERYVAENGINGFYNSIENRKSCCHIRKVAPLTRALKGAEIWISGLRREHSDARGKLGIAEWDAAHDLVKLYPLIDVTAETLWAYIREHDIPVNPMHERGFPSVGCAPCTRAVKPGEPSRAGRWWWEQDGAQECGLHMENGKLTRAKETTHA